MRRWQVVLLGVVVVAAAIAFGIYFYSERTTDVDVLRQTKQVDDVVVTLQLDEAALGQRTIDLHVEDSSGAPIELDALQLRFTMTDMDMGLIETTAERVEPGRYRVQGAFFSMVGTWQVQTLLSRADRAPTQLSFAVAIGAPGEAGGPLNPLRTDAISFAAGQQLYQANCASCHGDGGRGDGPLAAGLNPRPSDFAEHMPAGKHTDGQIFLWIRDGFPGTAMPAWGKRLSDEQIWQLVNYLRTFGQIDAAQMPSSSQAQAVPESNEPLPPLIFARGGNIWRSDGNGTLYQLTNYQGETHAQYPALSPDGQRIAFVTLTQPPANTEQLLPSSELLVMNFDGSDVRSVWKPNPGLLGIAAWSPDGNSIVVANNSSTTTNGATQRKLQLVRVDLASGAAQPLLDNALDPTFSRDGQQLAYLQVSADGLALALVLANADGSNGQTLIDFGTFQSLYAPRIAPDGQSIYFSAIGGPATDAQGQPLGTQPRTTPLEWALGLLEPPTAEAHGLPWDIWTINRDGSGLRRLTTIEEDLPIVAASPDGSQMAVMGAGGIYRANRDGSDLRKIDLLGDHGGVDWATR